MGSDYSIRALASLTGLSPHTIRAWEKRYNALTPSRTSTNRRTYRSEDVDRLLLLKGAVAAGHSIGRIAALDSDSLRSLRMGEPISPAPSEASAPPHGTYFDRCLEAIETMSPTLLEQTLTRGAVEVGLSQLIHSVIVPLISHLDQGWTAGSISIAQEHMVSAVIRSFLNRAQHSLTAPAGAPALVVTTPSGQQHELGAMLVAAMAALHSWRVVYLGPNLPAGEIAAAVRTSKADAVALSIVHPSDDPLLPDQLRSLRRELGHGVPVMVGGRVCGSYAPVLSEIDAKLATDLIDAERILHTL